VVTAGESGQLKVWDISSGTCIAEQDIARCHAFQAKQLMMTPSLAGMVTLSFDHQIQLFNADDLSRSRLVGGS
jgi:WD40 repeat protein